MKYLKHYNETKKELNYTKKIVGPIKVEDIKLIGHIYYIDTSEGAFKLSKRETRSEGFKLPTKGYNYVFEVIGDYINKIILYTVDVIVISDNKILLIKRKNEPFANHWAIPGGFIDVGEDAIDSAIRELKEETGLKLTNTELKFVGKYNKIYRDPRNKWSTTFAFVAKLNSIEKVTPMDDAIDAKWIQLSEINNLKLAFDHEEIIKDSIYKSNIKH